MTTEFPRCEFCKARFRAGEEAICLHQGAHKMSEKSGIVHFDPTTYSDQADHKLFHLQCWMTRFDMSEAEVEDLYTCAFCPEDLEGEPYFYEMELWMFDRDREGLFSIPTKDLQSNKVPRSYACKECVFDGVGDGSSSTACRILALEADEDDVESDLEEAQRFDDELLAARKIKRRKSVSIGRPPRRRAV